MTHDELQGLIDQGYFVHTWMAISDGNLDCPECGRFNTWGQKRKFPDNQRDVGLYCPHCGHLWSVILRPRFIAVHPSSIGEVTE